MTAVAAATLSVPQAAHAGVCDISASTNANTNRVAIQACLDSASGAVAQLGSASYPIDRYLSLGDSDQLVGSGATLILPAAPVSGQSMVRFAGSYATVAGLVIDANHKLNENGIMVVFESTAGDGNLLSGNWIEHGSDLTLDQQPIGPRPDRSLNGAYGVSIECTTCTGNLVQDNYIVEDYIGITFKGASSAARNVADGNTIADNQCDPASFAGFGVLQNNVIHDNGARCKDAAGGGVYANGWVDGVAYDHGGEIVGNDISNTCGHGLDLLNNHDFLISNNTISHPGTSLDDPNHVFCKGGDGIFMANMRNSTVSGNHVHNDASGNSKNMRVYGTAGGMQDTGQANWSDLPNGGYTLMAFTLVWTHDASHPTSHNTITNNDLHAYCDISNCVGVAAFIGRGTGYAGDNVTSGGSTWNLITGTRVAGSEYRTRRLGRNWWALNNPSCPNAAAWSANGCNDDDWHYATGASRNDGAYSATDLYNYS
jgi:hypothetical protein